MGKYLKISPPKRGSKITVAKNGQLQVPDDPIVPYIHGEGITPEIWRSVQAVFDVAVERCYANAKRIEWLEVYAGDKGAEVYGARLPEDTLRAIQEYKVCVKGPLVTPPGSPEPLDPTLWEKLDLFAHVQPIRYLEGAPSPLREPHAFDVLVFREHTEDCYSELEWKKGSPEAKQLINFLNADLAKKLNKQVRPDSSVGIKPISATATKRLIRLAIEYAVKHKKKSVTFVHKSSVMKHTEGFFRDWGYELARKEFAEYTISEQQVIDEHGGVPPRGKVLIKDRQLDELVQQLLVKPDEFDVIATTNLNGHFLESTALAATGTLGLAPNAYVGAKAAVFQATHTELPKTTGPNQINPVSLLLSGVMLFEHLGWKDSADLVTYSIIKTLSDGKVTPDLGRVLPNAQVVKTTELCDAIIENFEEVRKSRVRLAMKRAVSEPGHPATITVGSNGHGASNGANGHAPALGGDPKRISF
ncbi:isocitrate/isopropylmalate family dehydrogenase [Myxococcota bacterium]|nr:isocitrate/isopropylmalate family dehydrogenase [Myxococcota bacterium]